MARQGGFSLIETVVAIAVLGGALYAAAFVYAGAKQSTALIRQREAAWLAILSQENALRALSYSSLQPRSVSMAIDGLPGGRGVVTLSPIPGIDAYEARFEVTWRAARSPHRLTHAAVLSPFDRHAEITDP